MKAKYLNLKEGDVVKNGISGKHYDVTFKYGELHIGEIPISESVDDYTIVSRTPKLWLDMTPEEKGALLLAHHDGKSIENNASGQWIDAQPCWADDVAYRVKPEPKVEIVKIGGGYTKGMGWVFCSIHHKYVSHSITFNLINGEPDCSSVKMEKIK